MSEQGYCPNFSPGRPLVLNGAPSGRALSSEFLTDFAGHYHTDGKGIFDLITLAKVLKIEIDKPHDFDRPLSKEEALDRLERTAGPQARKMLERFFLRAGGAGRSQVQGRD